MVCPFCEHGDTKVVDKRESDTVSTRRRRECLSCHQRFTTYERVEQIEIFVMKHDGRREPFNPEKLRAGICLAIKKRPVTEAEVERMVDEIEAGLRGAKVREVRTEVLGGMVMEQLKRVDQVAYIRFASVHRDFSDAQSFQKEVKELLHSHRHEG